MDQMTSSPRSIARNHAFINDGQGHFTGGATGSGFGNLYGFTGGWIFSDIVTDFDGDGLPDIGTFDGTALYIHKNTTVVAPANLVTGFYPNNGGNTGVVSLTLIGNGFPSDAKVELSGPSGVLSPLSLSIAINASSISAVFDLTNILPEEKYFTLCY